MRSPRRWRPNGYHYIQPPRCGRSAEDGSSRVPLPSGRTPRPFAVRVPRGPHSTPPTVRAGPTPTVAGCSRAAPERPLPKGSHLVARNPIAPPIRPDPTTLRPRPDLPACFAIATPSPAPRPPSALRSRRWTTFQARDAWSTLLARHRADAIRAAMGWLVGLQAAPHRQDSLGLEFGILRTSLPLVLPVGCACGAQPRPRFDGCFNFMPPILLGNASRSTPISLPGDGHRARQQNTNDPRAAWAA